MSLILVIDDSDAMRSMMRRVLERAGYEVACAAGGASGVAACREIKPDLVITDIVMPERDGHWVIRQIRPDSATVGILAMSGGGCSVADDVLTIAGGLGADDTIGKPFDAAQLIAKVRAILDAQIERRAGR